jgi:phosphoglycolate phosphatase-like HAD superfamily hydrolase
MVRKKAEGPVTAALFDVDGTLVDTNYLHAVIWWEAFIQLGHVVAMTDIHRAIGMGSDEMLARSTRPPSPVLGDSLLGGAGGR